MAADPLEAVDWAELARGHWEAQAHPLAPSLTIGEYPVAMRLATALKQGSGHAEPAEAAAFWKMYQPILAQGIGPDQFMDRLHKLEQLSQTFHGRPPTLDEITTLDPNDPGKARKYYADLADADYAHVPAGEMVGRLFAARQYSQMFLNRDPTKGEAAFLYHAGLNGAAIGAHYQMLAADQAAKGTQDAPAESGQIDLKAASGIPPYGIGPGGAPNPAPRAPEPFGGFGGINIPVPAGDKPPPEGPGHIPPGGYGPGGEESAAPAAESGGAAAGPVA